MLALARGLGEFGATLMFAGSRLQTRTMAIQIYLLNSQPGDTYEERMWRIVWASFVLAFAAVAVGEYLARRGRRHGSA